MPEAVTGKTTQDAEPSAKSHDGLVNRNPDGVSFIELIREDFETHERDLFSQGFWAVFWHRFGNLRMSVKPRLLRMPLSVLYAVMLKLCQWVGGIYLPYTVLLGRRVKLEHFGGMILVADRIGDDVIIRQNTTFGIGSRDQLQARPRIGDRVEIGTGVVIIGGISVGCDVVVGANAVVTRSVPPQMLVGGVPARVIRRLYQAAAE